MLACLDKIGAQMINEGIILSGKTNNTKNTVIKVLRETYLTTVSNTNTL